MLLYLRCKAACGLMFTVAGGLLVCGLGVACAPIDESAEESALAPETVEEASQSAREAVATKQAKPSEEAASAPASTETSNADLKMNQAGLDIIKESEGLRLEAYQANGRWFIGYGHGRTAKAGMKITEAEAEDLLREDVAACEKDVAGSVPVALNENQFSALVSLCYNLGVGGYKRTSVYAALQEGDYQKAADSFPNHARARMGGELKVIPHLLDRREKEKALFLKPV